MIPVVLLGCGIFVGMCALVAWLQPWKLLPPSTGSLPAVPARSWLMGCGKEMGDASATGHSTIMLFRWLRDFGAGRFVAVPVPGQLLVLVNDLEVSKAINADRLFVQLSMIVDAFGAFSKGLATLDGDVWSIHRRAITRGFYPENLRYACIATDRVLSGWLRDVVRDAPPSDAYPVASWNAANTFFALYLDIMGYAMLSTDFGGVSHVREVATATVKSASSRASREERPRSPLMLEAFHAAFSTISKLLGTPKALWNYLIPPAELKQFYASTATIRGCVGQGCPVLWHAPAAA